MNSIISKKMFFKIIRAVRSFYRVFEKKNYFLSSSFERESYYKYYIDKAEVLGITCENLDGVLQLQKGGIIRRLYSSWLDVDSYPTGKIAGNKPICYKMLEKSKLPIPKYALVTKQSLNNSFDSIGGLNVANVVVKPASGTSSGEGLTINIDSNDKSTLRRAIYKGFAFSDDVLIEEFVEGVNYRMLVYKGEVLSAVVRQPPTVTGDGKSTVSELIAAENIARNTRLKKFPDLDHPYLLPIVINKRTLKNQGLKMNSVIDSGKVIFCRDESNYSVGGSTIEVTDKVHPEINNMVILAAESIGINLAGVDIICEDISAPLADSGAVINEVNTTPGLRLHYEVLNQESVKDPLDIILKDLFEIV